MSTKTIFSFLLAIIFITSCRPEEVVTQVPLSTRAISPSSTSESALNDPIIITLSQTTDYHAEVSYPPCKPINSGYMSILNAGCIFMIDIVDSPTQIDLGNSFQVIVLTPVDDGKSLVTIVKDGNEVYKIKIQQRTFSGLVSAWGYDNHWVIEVATPTGLDVIQDGESLKVKYNYDEVCGFQILRGKPFYFFRKSGYGNGIHYDSAVSHLDYDDMVCNNENPNSTMMNHYQNIVGFAVKQDGAWKSALIRTTEP